MISRVEDSYTTWNHTKITLVSGDRELGVWVQGLKFKHTTVPKEVSFEKIAFNSHQFSAVICKTSSAGKISQ